MWFSTHSKEIAYLKQNLQLVMRRLDSETVRIDVLSNALNTFKENLNAQWKIIEDQSKKIEELARLFTILDHIPGSPPQDISETHEAIIEESIRMGSFARKAAIKLLTKEVKEKREALLNDPEALYEWCQNPTPINVPEILRNYNDEE